jgi:TolA-binding protein
MKICPRCNSKYDDKANVCNHDGVKLETLPEFEAKTELADQMVGTVLAGRFKILSKLGQGGMGAVYKAEQVRMGRTCAVKVIPEEMASNRDAIERFDREARMSALINDPHAVTVYDFGETENGMYFLAMEYVEGETLSSLLRREGILPLSRTIGIVRQSGEALTAAHRQNVVHRDLKPDNIMISKKDNQDWVKVLDFGIAKISAEENRNDLTRAGLVVGTPLYMSPEQLSGEKLDPRSDIYSFALIVFQMLTGGLPFEGDNAQALMVKRLTENPLPIRAINPHVSVPPGVEAALMNALARDRNMRTATMKQFVEQFEQGTSGVVSPGPMQQQANTAPNRPPMPTSPQAQPFQTGPQSHQQTPYPPRPVDPRAGFGQPSGPRPIPGQMQPPQGYGQPSGPRPIAGPVPPANMPYSGPSGPQQAQFQTPQTPFAPMSAQYGPGQYIQPTPMPFSPPKKSRKGLWIFGTLLILTLLIGSCTALILMSAKNQNVDQPQNSGDSSSGPVDTTKGSDSGSGTKIPDSGVDAVTALNHYNRGVELLDSKDYSAASNEFRAALKSQSAYPEAQENLAVSLYKSRRFGDAVKESRKAVDLYGGKRAETYDLLGRSLYDNKQYLDAAQAFVQAFSLDTNNVEALALSGFSLHLAGQKDAADKVYDTFLTTYENNAQYQDLVDFVRQTKAGVQPPKELPQDDTKSAAP